MERVKGSTWHVIIVSSKVRGGNTYYKGEWFYGSGAHLSLTGPWVTTQGHVDVFIIGHVLSHRLGV